jgi:hypothetical protein
MVGVMVGEKADSSPIPKIVEKERSLSLSRIFSLADFIKSLVSCGIAADTLLHVY